MNFIATVRGTLLIALLSAVFSVAALADESTTPGWVKDGVDWGQFSKFIVKPLNMEDVRLIPPPWAENPADWELNMENADVIQAIYRDVMKAELGYPVVYAPGRDVLELNVEILSITPWLRPNEGGSMVGEQAMTMGTGTMSASVEIRDSVTRELLLMRTGETAIGEQYKEFTRENNLANIEQMFTNFARKLRAAMDEVHGR
jgi:hypothetical protein